jgi:hypothetical protein
MGMIGFISRMKDSFRQSQSNRSIEDNLKRVNELQELKEKRVRLEGKATLETLRQDELRRISQSSQTIKEGSKVHKFIKAVQGLQRVSNEKQGVFSAGINSSRPVKKSVTKGLQKVTNQPQGVFSQGSGLNMEHIKLETGSNNKKKSPFDLGR